MAYYQLNRVILRNCIPILPFEITYAIFATLSFPANNLFASFSTNTPKSFPISLPSMVSTLLIITSYSLPSSQSIVFLFTFVITPIPTLNSPFVKGTSTQSSFNTNTSNSNILKSQHCHHLQREEL